MKQKSNTVEEFSMQKQKAEYFKNMLHFRQNKKRGKVKQTPYVH